MPGPELQTQLKNIANFAYGSGKYEKTKGGTGNIALISGHVVKFNTHRGDKGGPVTAEMSKGCNDLRREIERIAMGLLRVSGVSANEYKEEIASIRAKLGLSPDGRTVVAKKLLDRKSVAAVIKQIDARTGQDSFKDAPTKSRNTKGVDTEFTAAVSAASRAVDEGFIGIFAGANEDQIYSMSRSLALCFGAMKPQDTNKDQAKFGSNSEYTNENIRIFRTVIERSVMAAYVENGKADEDLQAPGSAYMTIWSLIYNKQFSMRMATLALTLPPQDINAFLKACALVPDTTHGTIECFCAVAPQLARLPPSKFTVGNVLKLARPDLTVPFAIKKAKTPLSVEDQVRLFRPIDDLFTGDQKEKADSLNLSSLACCGASFTQIKAHLDKPKNFTLKMLPKTSFLPSLNTETRTCVDDSMTQLFKDLGQFRSQIAILGDDNDVRYRTPESLWKYMDDSGRANEEYQPDADAFKAGIAQLCGQENVTQQQLVLLFMSKNAAMPEALLKASLGKGKEVPENSQFFLKADPKTGDVFVTKMTDPELDWGMSVTIRIGTDGEMSVVDLQERNKPGKLEVVDPVPPEVVDPVPPEADLDQGVNAFEEMIARGVEKEVLNSYQSLAKDLVKDLLTKNGQKSFAAVEKDYTEFCTMIDGAAKDYALVGELTMGALKERLCSKDSSIRDTIGRLLNSFSKLSGRFLDYFAASDQKEGRFFELWHVYEARKSEMQTLVSDVQKPFENSDAGKMLVGKRLAARVLGRNNTPELLAGLKDRLADLARDLDEIKTNAAKGTSVVDKAARLKRLEIDLVVASEALRNKMLDALELMRKDDAKLIDLTVLRGFRSEIELMQKEIRKIRGATVAERGVQLVEDYCSSDYPMSFKTVLDVNLKPWAEQLSRTNRKMGKPDKIVATIREDLLTKVPAALGKLSAAVRDYLSATDAKSSSAAQKILEKRARELKNLELRHPTKIFLRSLMGSQSDQKALGIDAAFARQINELAQKDGPFSAKALYYVADADNVDRLIGYVKWFRAYGQTDFGARAANDKVLQGLLDDRYGIGTYVGARVWQATPDMIDPSLREADLADFKRLDSGVSSTTYLCSFRTPDGPNRSYVFKPELVGRNAVETMPLMGGVYRSDQQLAHLNFASAQAARELGMPGKVVDVRVGTLKGTFGIFMDVAPGVSAKDMKKKDDEAKRKLMEFMGFDSDGNLPPGKAPNARNIGKIAHATTDLEWLDAVIGNGDRHGGNAHIDVREDGNVTVTGIDNDTTFPSWVVGFGKYRLDESLFKARVRQSPERWRTEYSKLFQNARGADKAIQIEKGVVTIDLYAIDVATEEGKMAFSWLASLMHTAFGIQCFTRPNFISRSTYDNLKRICCGKKVDGILQVNGDGEAAFDEDEFNKPKLRDDNELIEYIMQTYGPHLKDPDQVEALVSRLKDAWNHARKLEGEGRLVENDADWGGRACYNKILQDWNEERSFNNQSWPLSAEYKNAKPYLSFLNRCILAFVNLENAEPMREPEAKVESVEPGSRTESVRSSGPENDNVIGENDNVIGEEDDGEVIRENDNIIRKEDDGGVMTESGAQANLVIAFGHLKNVIAENGDAKDIDAAKAEVEQMQNELFAARIDKDFLKKVTDEFNTSRLSYKQQRISDVQAWRRAYARVCFDELIGKIQDPNFRQAFVTDNYIGSKYTSQELIGAFGVLSAGIGGNNRVWEAFCAEMDKEIGNEHMPGVAKTRQNELLMAEIMAIAAARKANGIERVKHADLVLASAPIADLNHCPIGLNPDEEIAEQIQFKQTPGKNTCPLISTINAMLLTGGRTRARLIESMTKKPARTGDQYVFPNGITVSTDEINLSKPANIIKWQKVFGLYYVHFSALSEFEKAALVAVNKKIDEQGFGEKIMPGQFAELINVFGLFGLEIDNFGTANSHSLTEAEMLVYANMAREALAAGKVCVFRIPGHFMALDGVTFGPDGVKFLVTDSTREPPQRSLGFAELKSMQEGFQIYTGSLPPVNEPIDRNVKELLNELGEISVTMQIPRDSQAAAKAVVRFCTELRVHIENDLARLSSPTTDTAKNLIDLSIAQKTTFGRALEVLRNCTVLENIAARQTFKFKLEGRLKGGADVSIEALYDEILKHISKDPDHLASKNGRHKPIS